MQEAQTACHRSNPTQSQYPASTLASVTSASPIILCPLSTALSATMEVWPRWEFSLCLFSHAAPSSLPPTPILLSDRCRFDQRPPRQATSNHDPSPPHSPALCAPVRQVQVGSLEHRRKLVPVQEAAAISVSRQEQLCTSVGVWARGTHITLSAGLYHLPVTCLLYVSAA